MHKNIKHILSIFLLLILQINFAQTYAIAFSNEKICVSNIEFSETGNTNSSFLKPDFQENHIFEPSFLDNISYQSIFSCGDYGELVEAWKKVSDGGINDFINQPGYIETLQKIAKYQDEALSGATGNVKYYRVQTEHPLSKALSVENNNLVFHKSDKALNISTTSRTHADYYATKKIEQGHTVEIIEFEVPKSIDIQMKQVAVPQYKAPQNLLNADGKASKIVDPTQPGDPFELSPHWHQLIEQNYIKGSAKIVQ